jgi:hypothetical protein
MEDMDIDELDEMVTAGPSSRTRASDRIRVIFHSTGTRPPIHIDLTEEAPAATNPPRTGPKTRGGGTRRKTVGGGPRGVRTRGGFAFQTGVGRSGAGGVGGAATSGAGRGGAAATSGGINVGRGGAGGAATSGAVRGGDTATSGAGRW